MTQGPFTNYNNDYNKLFREFHFEQCRSLVFPFHKYLKTVENINILKHISLICESCGLIQKPQECNYQKL